MKRTFYVTTPIYYVNDVPHIGHAYTTIAADVLARYHRAAGREVFFLTGTDEHGQKVEQAARKRNISPKEHCDEMYVPFKRLWERLNIVPSMFIRTTDPAHERVVQQAMRILHDRGLIVKRTYEGWYSTSSERFWMEKDLIDGKDPDSGLPVEWISESNYFFLMSRFKGQLLDHLASHPDFIQPRSRYNEIVGFLERDLEDLCISRPKSRLAWGIELPFDPDYVTYVWFDALLNYLSAIGFLKEDTSLMKFWPADFHLIGKDILTTHSVYWITMLFALGIEPPRHLFAHGWWTVEGRKMSKSYRNVIDPNVLIDTYGPDTVRYFLMREIPFGHDGDFSHAALIGRINADLANDLGNALNRAVAMTEQNFGGIIPEPDQRTTDDDIVLFDHAASLVKKVESHLGQSTDLNSDARGETLNFSAALEDIWGFIRFINKYIDTQAPWKLARENDTQRLATVLYNCLEACRVAAVYLAPFMPEKAAIMMKILGQHEDDLNTQPPDELFLLESVVTWGNLTPGRKVSSGIILFPRIEPEQIRPVLTDVLSLASTADEALSIFQSMFPKIKPGKAKQFIEELLPPVPASSESVNAVPGQAAGQAASEDKPTETSPEIDYSLFSSVDLRIAVVLEAERVPKSNKLIRLTVDIGSGQRQIVAGIGLVYEPSQLIGRKIAVVANLKPAKLMGLESRGMLLAASDDSGLFLLGVDDKARPGMKIK